MLYCHNFNLGQRGVSRESEWLTLIQNQKYDNTPWAWPSPSASLALGLALSVENVVALGLRAWAAVIQFVLARNRKTQRTDERERMQLSAQIRNNKIIINTVTQYTLAGYWYS